MIEFEFGTDSDIAKSLANLRDRPVSQSGSTAVLQWQQAAEVLGDAIAEIDRREIFGSTSRGEQPRKGQRSTEYVHSQRIDEIRKLDGFRLDTKRLVRLLQELNIAYENEAWFCVIAMQRTIMNHIPPAFGHSKFEQVRSQYNGKSLGKTMDTFADSLKHLADEHLHQPMRQHDPLPLEQQVDFKAPLDRLLVEVIRVLQ